jgi:hypothetical protein
MTKELVLPDFMNLPEMSLQDVRDLISRVEEACLLSEDIIDIPVVHHFSSKVYAREMQMPKGALIVGKIHKKENMNILSKGEVSVLSIDGVKRVSAPHTFVASPGAKRVIFAHEDVVWTTIHGTEETDIDKIENEFIAKTYEELPLEVKEKLCLG